MECGRNFERRSAKSARAANWIKFLVHRKRINRYKAGPFDPAPARLRSSGFQTSRTPVLQIERKSLPQYDRVIRFTVFNNNLKQIIFNFWLIMEIHSVTTPVFNVFISQYSNRISDIWKNWSNWSSNSPFFI